jgi:hypothetical protein
MIGTIATLVMGMAAASAVPEQAQPRTPAQAAASRAARRICRTDRQIGSRLRGNVRCMTAAEWTAQAREARSSAERIQRGTAACLMGPNEPGHGPTLVCSSFGP